MKTCFSGLQDDEEPQDTQYQIDGSYIPRIFILGKQKIGWCHPGFLGLKKTRVYTLSFSLVYQFLDISYTMLLFLDMLKNVLVDKEVHWPIYRRFIGT